MDKMMVEMQVSDQRVKDLLTGAMEGGSNYWYMIHEYVYADGVKKPEFPHIDLPFIEGCGLLIGDAEDEEATPNLLNKESLNKGLKIMSEKYPAHFGNFMSECDDAETSDVFLQCCLFGEIIFG